MRQARSVQLVAQRRLLDLHMRSQVCPHCCFMSLHRLQTRYSQAMLSAAHAVCTLIIDEWQRPMMFMQHALQTYVSIHAQHMSINQSWINLDGGIHHNHTHLCISCDSVSRLDLLYIRPGVKQSRTAQAHSASCVLQHASTMFCNRLHAQLHAGIQH